MTAQRRQFQDLVSRLMISDPLATTGECVALARSLMGTEVHNFGLVTTRAEQSPSAPLVPPRVGTDLPGPNGAEG